MDLFLDKVKVNLDANVEKYFANVEIESVNEDIVNNTLNFYLISHEIIPYYYVKDARLSMIEQLFSIELRKKIESGDITKSPINLIIKYKISDSYTPKFLFEEIREDLIRELKEKSDILAFVFKSTKYEFLDDNTIKLYFDDYFQLQSKQDELVKFLNYVFHDRYDRDIVIQAEKISIAPKEGIERPATIKAEIENANEISNTMNEQKEVGIAADNKKKKRGFGFVDEGDILYGKDNHKKTKLTEINSIYTEMDSVTIKAVIYNYTSRDLKNGKTIYDLYLFDGSGCIITEIWGDPEDKTIFKIRFKIGDEVFVSGRIKNDTFKHTFIIQPNCIKKNGHKKMIEFGEVGSEDYYNVIVTDREDNEKEKRVELHLHTKSSAKDGVGEVAAYIETARKFGMSAMAITDHGCVNALADARDYLNKIKKSEKRDPGIKIINGVEGYLVNDYRSFYYDKDGKETTESCHINGKFVIYDFVTTGLNIKKDSVIQVYALLINENKVVDSFNSYVYLDRPLKYEIKDAYKESNKEEIKDSKLAVAPKLKDVLQSLLKFGDGAVFVNLNKNSTWELNNLFETNDIKNDVKHIDLICLSRLIINDLKTDGLQAIARALNVKVAGITDRKKEEKKVALGIYDSVKLAGEIFNSLLLKIADEFKIDDLSLVNGKVDVGNDFLKRQKYYHIILLAKNDVGRVNLYKLVSDSHIKYMYKRPRIPRSLLNEYREGIIVGSACIMGEFMDAIKNGVDDEKLKNIASYYDYLEIQPYMNNSFLLKEDAENFKSITDLQNLNKKVIEIGDALGKLVVATCDCHYVEKEDKLYRDILIRGSMHKKSNVDSEGKIKEEVASEFESSSDEELYFRTTREMLDEFNYLGYDKAYEVVVKNTNIISNMVEYIEPLRLDKCPPNIEGSDDELKNACYENLKNKFGDNPEPAIIERLDNELNYIIDNGYSVMYIAAKKLIDYSKENGYPVGSRGSVGSSLAATLSGVSEVNPLPPYYLCPKCHHIEYNTEETNKYVNDTGYDMPDKKCPKCGCMMDKDGVNIPFETFLGIPGKAAKEPDIDLNFASVFQSKIHEYTVSIFDRKNTFKAGTVGTIAAKTAYGFVKGYNEDKQLNLTNERIDYYKNKILGCKNTTGQHPGGMVVVPRGEEIYTFTPIQIAADKESNTTNITTHFDYHKIDANLLKLDILGHESPYMLKKLFSLTGEDFNNVPFYEEAVLKLFENTESLGITSADISGTRLGCLSIPEFGTDFAMRMCEDAKPKTVADLIRIAGLAHGTDVWQGNVQDLIKNGDCTLANAICCRDDIMIYLIERGLDQGLAFNIMESVRKGKGLTPEWIDEMKSHDVPDWYIGCCKKIKYMFPKAHAAAYVLASLRIAYYKIHYPKEYYAAYFSIRKDGIDYSLIMKDREEIHFLIEKFHRELNSIKGSNTEDIVDTDSENDNTEENNEETKIDSKEKKVSKKNLSDQYMCLRIVEEMKARGVDFCPIDIYKAKRSDFQVIDGKIMPSFDSIPGIGVKNIDIDYNPDTAPKLRSTAMKCELEGTRGEYTSIENFRKRTGVNKTIIEDMKVLGLLDGLKETDQNTLFDFL